MSYAIIRNANYKRDNLAGLYKHNERKNTNYSNKDINKNNSINNYSIKKCNTTYSKAIKQLINENDLIYGEMPKELNDIVVDKIVIENMFKSIHLDFISSLHKRRCSRCIKCIIKRLK